MGYLDYAGLQYLWGKLKEKFSPKSHSHDDRYYTESEMDGKLNSKVNNNEDGANGLLSKLTTSWTATPTDNTYFIRQDTGGGNSFGRVKFSTLWTYIKSKADGTYQPKGSYAANGHTHDDRYYTEAEVNGKLTEKLHEETITDARDLNTIKTTGVYHLKTTSYTNGPGISNHATIFVDYTVGTPYQIFIPDSVNRAWRRNHVNSNDTWSAWTELKYTDTNTWRGIQNNLTSDSTTDSLSAAQGKALKTLVDGKAPNGHTHSFASITDKPSTYTPSAHNQSWNTITGKPALMESGDYSAETIEALLKLVQGLSPRMGSCCFAKDTHVANTWWNFIYTPHRTGSGGDNPEYGTLLLFPMVGVGSSYIVRAGKDGIVREIRKIYTSGDKPTKGDVGLGNVDNTADANKSVKYATSAGSASTAAKATTAGTADKANSVDWSKVQNKPSSYPPSSHSHAYLPLGGGTISGQIKRDVGCSWIYDRDNAIVYGTSSGTSTGYHPVIGQKTPSGAWTIGTYSDERLIFDYTTDANKTAGTNKATQVYLPAQDGTIITSATIGSQNVASANGVTPEWSGSVDLNSSSWLAAWSSDGKKIKAMSTGTFAKASHTHTKAQVGLSNVDNTADKNKSVASAAKLTTARTVSGGSDITLSFNYDGSGNSTANIGFYSCKHSVDNTNNYPFHRFARIDANKNAWVDRSMTFFISQDYSGGGYGICRLVYRSNADSGNASVDAQWLVRKGFSADTIQVAIKTDKTNGAYCDAFYKSSGTYMGVVIRAIASGGRATSGRTWTLVDSNEVGGTTATDKKTSSECWKTIADAGTALHKQAYSASASAKDEGYVASAGSANTSSSCAGNSASATKLTSSAGSATQPVYFKDGKPVAGTYTLGDASSKTVRTLGAVGNTGWANKTTDDKYIPTMSFMAYWNGAYSGTSSNLQYCDRGRFGTIVTKGSGDYAAAGHTHNYAGSGSAGGSANSAVKLDSNAGSSVQPVYFSGGKPVAIGYTISSSVPANAKFTDTTYGVASSSSNGLMSSTDKTKLDDFSRVINFQKQIKLTTDWLDTGIAGNSLDTGTYVVQVSGFNSSHTQLYSEIYSGVMSWYSGTTNSGNSSEIFLHNAGLADNNNAIYLRTLRVAGSKTLKLQIACKVAATGTDTLTFKFRRLI